MFSIGSWTVKSHAVLAPMAGISDYPFRTLCRRFGAGLTTSEMVSADTGLWHTRKSQKRLPCLGDAEPRSVQLVGNDPETMATAAQENVALGAQIIDINMGCPAKKVCKKAAGSALLRDEKRVEHILRQVVAAVDVPVTLKIRTGWSPEERNGVTIARIAQTCGIQALAVHGRTRACGFSGNAEYDTIAKIVDSVTIPVLANGDIHSAKQAQAVLDITGACAVMIGRGAQGNPWLFREINHYLDTGELLAPPTITELSRTLCTHITELHQFYGDTTGLRIARKHVSWYLQYLIDQLLPEALDQSQQRQQYQDFRKQFNQIESAQTQCDSLLSYLHTLPKPEEKAA